MVGLTSSIKHKGLTLVFGPQDPNLDDEPLQALRTTLLGTPDLQWIVEILKQLPQQWQKISKLHPDLRAFQGQRYLQLLNEWIRQGALPTNAFPLPNILITPLAVTAHLVQYIQFVEKLNAGVKPNENLQDIFELDTETVGVCTGLLSAAAVASSASLADLRKHGAVAIRMAMAIGALVDAGNTNLDGGDKWQSLAISWKTHSAETEFHRILEEFPNAYVSAISAARLVTLTMLKADIPEMLEKLKDADLFFTKAALRGPFHCREREEQVASLLHIFDSDSSFRFPHTSQLVFRTRSTDGRPLNAKDNLNHTTARAILTEQANWYRLFNELHETTSASRPSLVVCFGSWDFVPQWLMRKLGAKVAYANDVNFETGHRLSTLDTLRDDDTYALIHEIAEDLKGSAKSSLSLPHVESPVDIDNVPLSGQILAGSIVEAFTQAKLLTDKFIESTGLSGYYDNVQPRLTELVVAYTLDAFEHLGCSLRVAQSGQTLQRIPHLPKHNKIVDALYNLLQNAQFLDLNGSSITRTAIPLSPISASQLQQEFLSEYPEHAIECKLTSLTGARLADCLSGKVEAIDLLFGTEEGRELATDLYGKAPVSVAWLRQLQYFWEQLLAHLPQWQQSPIKILEIGAGTGGTTAAMIPLLARSHVPVHYTASDISPSLVAGLRKRFKDYPWMSFEVVDIEKSPPHHLLESQHVVLASNVIHATQSLAVTTKNIHSVLHPDGALVLLEMTEALPWVNSVFGLVEGWWLFNDGRHHALAEPDLWEKILHSNGYGHIDWTDGQLPENPIQRIILALASGQHEPSI
ncbi:hypothetical protein ETB97_006460 [Aspergillus alliaceus]|uniref:Uncharacterized protein n=1 Tax=Petromyces alliaceus TaxID=209559 RepID=A0A8H6E2H8_PETAA|nr:hypothetical protein ETB97_006460 [Aspergillus burnettii]